MWRPGETAWPFRASVCVWLRERWSVCVCVCMCGCVRADYRDSAARTFPGARARPVCGVADPLISLVSRACVPLCARRGVDGLVRWLTGALFVLVSVRAAVRCGGCGAPGRGRAWRCAACRGCELTCAVHTCAVAPPSLPSSLLSPSIGVYRSLSFTAFACLCVFHGAASPFLAFLRSGLLFHAFPLMDSRLPPPGTSCAFRLSLSHASLRSHPRHGPSHATVHAAFLLRPPPVPRPPPPSSPPPFAARPPARPPRPANANALPPPRRPPRVPLSSPAPRAPRDARLAAPPSPSPSAARRVACRGVREGAGVCGARACVCPLRRPFLFSPLPTLGVLCRQYWSRYLPLCVCAPSSPLLRHARRLLLASSSSPHLSCMFPSLPLPLSPFLLLLPVAPRAAALRR